MRPCMQTCLHATLQGYSCLALLRLGAVDAHMHADPPAGTHGCLFCPRCFSLERTRACKPGNMCENVTLNTGTISHPSPNRHAPPSHYPLFVCSRPANTSVSALVPFDCADILTIMMSRARPTPAPTAAKCLYLPHMPYNT